MYLIKTCSSCNRKLRFPIDKGKIQIKCTCGNQFIANPDDSELYKDSRFDLSQNNNKKKVFDVRQIIDSAIVEGVFNKIVSRLFDLKYKLQNFNLLPITDKIRLIFIILLVISFLAVLFYFFVLHTTNGINEDPFVV